VCSGPKNLRLVEGADSNPERRAGNPVIGLLRKTHFAAHPAFGAAASRKSRKIAGKSLEIKSMLLDPASAKCVVNLHQGSQFILLGLGEVELRGEIVGVVGQNFQVARYACLIADLG
jgi:hypothetical protein